MAMEGLLLFTVLASCGVLAFGICQIRNDVEELKKKLHELQTELEISKR
jgi:hypothetical protein